jgi:hypothetical protein
LRRDAPGPTRVGADFVYWDDTTWILVSVRIFAIRAVAFGAVLNEQYSAGRGAFGIDAFGKHLRIAHRQLHLAEVGDELLGGSEPAASRMRPVQRSPAGIFRRSPDSARR